MESTSLGPDKETLDRFHRQQRTLVYSLPFTDKETEAQRGDDIVAGVRRWALWPESYVDSVTNPHDDDLRSYIYTVAIPASQIGKLRNKEIMPVILVTLSGVAAQGLHVCHGQGWD